MSIVKVAKIAGVSHSTVSRVINGHNSISPKTVALVKKAMKEINYTPIDPEHRRGPRARSTKPQKTGNVAVLVFDGSMVLASTHFSQALRSIILALTENGLNAVVGNICGVDFIPPALQKNQVDGIIVLTGELDPEFSEKLPDVPIIYLSSGHTANGDRVISGNHAVGELAAEYLLKRGHTNIACLNGLPDHPAIKTRVLGFQFAAYQRGVEMTILMDEHNRFPTMRPRSLEDIEISVKPLVDRLLQLDPLPTGLFVPQDFMTAKVYRFLNRAHIRPGKDIKIISADNERPWLAGLDPLPATIDIGNEALGRHAVEQLVYRMKYPESSRGIQVTIEPVLVEGEE